MKLWRQFLVFLCLALALGLASCGSSATGTVGDAAGITTGGGLSGEQLASSGQLPSIPLDDNVAHGASADSGNGSGGDPGQIPPPPGGGDPPPGALGSVTVLGKDFLQQWSGQVQGDALDLDPALAGGPRGLAFGLYKVGGLDGKRPLYMNVEALPGALEQEYFVAIADYTNGQWSWFGPSSLPEFQIDLQKRDSRYVSVAGNMYFLVVTHGVNTALHSQTTVTYGELGGHERPGCPVALQASDGALPDGVQLNWTRPQGAENYEVFRAIPTDPNGGQRPDWQSLGFTTEQSYLDGAVEVGKPYIYRVRAINANGDSCFSNVDGGFAGQAGPPPIDGTIMGRVVGPEGNGLPGIVVGAAGIPAPPPGSGQQPPPPGDFVMTQTGPDGGFGFPHLPAGMYIICPQNPELDFQPRFLLIGIDQQHTSVTVEFHAVPGQMKDALWGFAWTMGGPDHPGLHPIDGATVAIHDPATGNTLMTVTTDQNGFWVAGGLPVGGYAITCAKEGWNFAPPMRDGHIDGAHMSPARNFFGQPADPAGGNGGGDPGQP